MLSFLFKLSVFTDPKFLFTNGVPEKRLGLVKLFNTLVEPLLVTAAITVLPEIVSAGKV